MQKSFWVSLWCPSCYQGGGVVVKDCFRRKECQMHQ